MECVTAREVLSAVLDGERADGDADRAERHRATCPACARWYAEAARLNRMLRLTPAGGAGPDPSEAILTRVRLPRRSRWRAPLRIVLLVVAVAQLGIGLVSLFLPVGMAMAVPGNAHMDHEEAAFNLAFGVALLAVGVNTRRAATQVPVLGSFVLVLAVASVFDLADGAVGWSRLATHTPVVVGLLLAVALARSPHPDTRSAGDATGTVTAGTDSGRSDPVELRPVEDTAASGHNHPPAAHRKTA
jgi:predicted anti-sigma-YlaC factor YlaD